MLPSSVHTNDMGLRVQYGYNAASDGRTSGPTTVAGTPRSYSCTPLRRYQHTLSPIYSSVLTVVHECDSPQSLAPSRALCHSSV